MFLHDQLHSGGCVLRSKTQFVVLAVYLIFALGCGPSGQVKVYPVKGRVMFEGKPMVGGGGISFVPKSEQSGKAPGGIINPDGTYVLGTYAQDDGSMAGDFRVVIFQETVQESAPTPDGARPAAAATATVAPTDKIPAIYSSDRGSPLSAKVEPKPQEINFDLKRQP